MPTLQIDTAVQGGSFDPTTGIWTPEGFLLATLGSGIERWTVFNHAPLLATDLKGGPLLTALSMELFPLGFTETGTLTFYSVQWIVRTNFSTARPPRPARLIGSVTATLTDGTQNRVVVPITTSTGQSTVIEAQLLHRVADGSGAFRTAIGATWSEAGGLTTFREPRITFEQGFTGLSGPYMAQGRADECPKCGNRTTRDTWQRDGWTDMMVCGRCYDPDDPVGKTRMPVEHPPVNEG